MAGKLILHDLPPFTAGLLRYGLASAVLVAAYWREIRAALPSLERRDLWLLLGVGVLGTFLNHALFFLALLWAPASHGSILPPTSSPIWTLVLASRLGGERVARGQVAGVVLCSVGVLLVARPDRLLSASGRSVLLGDLLFLLGGAAWGAYSYASKVAMQRLSASATLTIGIAIGTLFLLPTALLERPWDAIRATGPTAWGAMVYLALGGTVLSFLWWNLGIRRIGAGRTAVFSNLVPVFGVLLAWLILGEQVGGLQLLGGLVAVAGVVACQGAIIRPALAGPFRLARPSSGSPR